MQEIGRGGTILLDAFYELGGTGALTDPTNPRIDIIDPANVTVVTQAVPTRDYEGHYTYGYAVAANAPLGTWTARWWGVVNGVQVGPTDDPFGVVEAAEITFGTTATVEGALAYLPHRTVTATTKLTLSDVGRFLDAIQSRVTSRIGTGFAAAAALGDTDELVAIWRQAERNLVELGTAAWTEDALFPEGATVQTGDEAPYGARLWDRFTRGLDSLATAMESYLKSRGAGAIVGATTGSPSYAFPAATITDELRW